MPDLAERPGRFITLSVLAMQALLTAGRPARGDFAIATNGEPTTVIRLAADAGPELQYAAARLQHYVRRVSGAELALSREHGPGIQLSVDPTLGDSLTSDGYVIRIGPDGVQLIGASPVATVYAAYTLLDEYVGCRWFTAEPMGEDLPHTSTIALAPGEKRYRPAFCFRSIGGIGNREWAVQQRLSENLRIGRESYSKVWGVAHTYYRLLPPEEYFDKHPGWFALVNGKRMGPVEHPASGPQICTSNPGAIRAVADRINRMFDENPRLEMITLGPNDGRHAWCECKECQALDEPGKEWRGQEHRLEWRGQLSRRVMLFNNAVARLVRAKHPDKRIKAMVYCWYQEPPTDPTLRFEDNISVMLTHSGNPSGFESVWPSCYNHPLTYADCPPNQTRFVPALTSWAKRCSQLGIYEYYVKASVCETLFPIVHTIRRDIPYYHSQGATYFHTQGRANGGPVTSLNLYVTAKLLWDVDADVDALLDDYYRRFYREAREPMQAYHEMLERIMFERGGDVLGWLFHLPKVYDGRTARELRRRIDQAEQLARTDIVRERIGRARMELEYTLLATRLWRELETGYAELKSADGGDWTGGKTQTLAARIKPHQDALRDYCESHKPLRWVPNSRNGYLSALFGPGMAHLYPTLLPKPPAKP
jgi:hypothetical protein